jgi:phosphatidylglycerophosphate synthase
MKQSYTFKEIRASYTDEKKAADGPWTRFVLRPLSFVVSKLFLSIGLSPDAVSYISSFIAVAGFFLLAFGTRPLVYLGFLLFFLFGVFDCADGNMARTIRGKNPEGRDGGAYGEWVDAVSGYIAYAAFLLGIGAAEGSRFWLLAAAAALAGNLLMRLAFQNYRASAPPGKARDETGGERVFSESIGITGAMVPLSIIAFAFHFLWIVIALYAVIYCGGFFMILLKIIKKMKNDSPGA